ncbi:MAG TPA: PAS domain S-box protein [Chroococcales cyanobacterium]
MLTAQQSSNILIVDNQPTSLKMLSSLLQESGFNVLVAKTGKSAIRKLQKVSPDLIVLDAIGPELDGFETCHHLKSSPKTRDIPVILMTPLSESMDISQAFKVGASDYITKPFKKQEILARINQQIQLKRLQKQLKEQNQQLQQEIRDRVREAAQRKVAAKHCQTLEERLKLVSQASNDGFWDWNIESGDLYISPRCKQMLGYSDKELPNDISSWANLAFPEDRIIPSKLIEGSDSDTISRYESTQRFRHKNGSTVHILSRTLHLKDADGQVNRLIGTYTDITEITTTLEALRQSRRLLAGVLNSCLDGVAAFSALRDNQGNIIDFIWLLQNPAAETILGRQESDLVGKQLLVEMPKHRQTDLFEKYVRVVETGEPLQTEVYYADEKVRLWLQIAAVKLGDGFAVTFRDITERKQMEERNRALLNAIPDVIFRQRVDGTYLDVQAKEGKLLAPPEILIGSNLRDRLLPETLKQDVLAHLRTAVETGELQTYEYELLKPDGVHSYEARFVRSGADEALRIVRDVTDRKWAEAALRKSEAQFRGIFQSAAIGIGITGADGKVIMANPTLEAFLGYSEAEMQSPDSPNITYPDDRDRDLTLTQDVIDGVRDSFQLEKRYIRKDGHIFWGRLTLSAVRNAKGEFQFIVAIVEDINDRKLRELALEESERRFRAIFNNSFQFTGLLKPDGTLLDANQTALNFAGIALPDVAGLPFWQTFWWREGDGENASPQTQDKSQPFTLSPKQQQLREAIEQAASGEFVRYEVDIRGVGDRVITIDFSIKPVFNKRGKVVLLIPEGRDITERKHSEERLRLLESAVVNANDAIIIAEAKPVTGPSPKIIYVNEAFTRMTGYSPEEAIGRTPRMLQGPKTDRAELRKIRHAIETWQSVRVELMNYRKDGSEFWIELEIVPVGDETGSFTHWVSVQRDITDRKRSQERLLLLERAISASKNGIAISDAQAPGNPIIYVNSGFERMTGYREADMIGTPCRPCDRTDAAPTTLEELRHALAQGRETQVTLQNTRRDGTLFWSEFCVTPVRDATGRLTHFIGVQTDISDRKQAEDALKESEERFRTMADSTAVMLWVSGIDGKCSFFNQTWLEFTGHTLEEELAIGWFDVHPDDRQRCIELYRQAFEARESFEMEYRLLRFDGEYRWVVDLGKPRFTPNGSFAGYIGSCLDITERKIAQLNITTAKAALERQMQRALLLGQITQEIRSSLKSERIFQTAVTQVGQAFGADRCLLHTYIDRPIPQIPLVAEYEQSGIESISSLDIPVLGNPHVQLLLTQDSAIASDNVYADPLLEAASSLCHQLGLKSMLAVRTSYRGKPNGVIAIHQYDRFRQWREEEIELMEAVAAQVGIAIAQAKLLEQEKQQRQELALQNQALEKAKLEAEAANRAKSLFLSKMSHELRTPLNAILGFTQIVIRDRSLKAEQIEYLGIINRSGEHLLELINDILSMSKIEAGQVTFNENSFDLYRLLDSLEEMLRLKASSKNLTLLFERTPDVPQYVQTDEGKLRQVLLNLLGNAIKFTQTGSITLQVGIGPREWGLEQQPITNNQQPTTLFFAVRDTGPGISPEELGILFDPFLQTETGRQSTEGTGLGLPISQQFVRLMGGEIAVSSTLGQGSIFSFDIQVGVVDAVEEKPSSSQRRVMGLEPNQPDYRILVVEDVVENRQLLVEMLEFVGFQVREATNGQEGVALWESWSPHLICMDILMPVMDGYEATQQIKQTPQARDTIIIALTASAFEEQRDVIFKAGCDDFLPKPFREEALLEKIALHLGVRYVYEGEQSSALLRSPTVVERLTPDALAVMPVSWIDELYQAALYADDELMNQLIEQIPVSFSCLRCALSEMLNNFRLEELISLTELARSTEAEIRNE